MEFELIAHRGGIVDRLEDENTLRAIDRAAESGYYGVEIDVRETRDGVPVLNHHPHFGRRFGARGVIEELSYEELVTLASRLGRPTPPTIEEAAERCAGRLAVMLEAKEEAPSSGHFERVSSVLERHGLLESLLVIGSAAGLSWFGERGALTCVRIRGFRERLDSLDTLRGRFLFAHGTELTADDCRAAQEAGLLVVPTVNTFHYRTERPKKGAARDFAMLKRAGVKRFQIDSVFESIFLDA